MQQNMYIQEVAKISAVYSCELVTESNCAVLTERTDAAHVAFN